MITGIQVSSLRPLLMSSQQVTDTFRRLAQMGCMTVQLQWIDPSVSPEEIARSLREFGLASVSVQDPYTEIMAHESYYTSLCTLTGSPWLCVGRIPMPYRSTQGIRAYAHELERLAERVAPLGLKLCFHATSPDYQPIEGQNPVELLLDAVQMPLHICLDLFHAERSGVNTVSFLKKYQGLVCMAHFKDYKITPEGRTVLVPAGQGVIDWPPILDACLETGVEYGFVEQESWSKDPFDCMSEALSWLNGQISGK